MAVKEKLRLGVNASKNSTIALVFLAAIKGIVGFYSGSSSLLADAIHTSMDIFTSLAVWIGLKLSLKSSGEQFHYGYYKAENLVALFVSVLILLSGVELVRGALKSIKHPDAAVVCYVNSSALIKAQCDICCTSANAIDVVNSLEEDEVIFVPDKNLGNYVAGFTDKKIYPWDGFCPTHHQMRGHDVIKAKEEHPNALFLAHPECRTEVLDLADEVLSTTGILNYAKKSDAKEFIIGTENGLLHRLSKENPEKNFYYVSEFTICTNMKITTLESVLDALENMQYVITVPEDTRIKAKKALDRMLAVKRTM